MRPWLKPMIAEACYLLALLLASPAYAQTATPIDPDALKPGQRLTLTGEKQSVTLLVESAVPVGTFDVTKYGAIPDDGKDDTAAIRQAIEAAAKLGDTSDVVFPAGTFDVCPQADDPAGTYRPVFKLAKGVHLRGAGSDKTTVRGWYDGLADPMKTWKNLGPKDYFKVQRFSLFQCITNRLTGPCGVVKFTGLTLDGGCPYTGNHSVGGVQSSGDGWDMTHKGLHFDGNQPIAGCELFDVIVQHWKGEAIYAGGEALKYMTMDRCTVRGSNASAVSVSTAFKATDCTFGGSEAGHRVYNGLENFCFVKGQSTALVRCKVQCGDKDKPRGNGIAFLGVTGTTLLIDDCDFQFNQFAVLLSETGKNVTIKNSRCTGVLAITSILGLYPKYERGFADMVIDGNTVTAGKLLIGQTGHCSGFKVTNNTVSDGLLLEGTYNSPADGFEVSGNKLVRSKAVAPSYKGTAAGQWKDNTRDGIEPKASVPKVDLYDGRAESVLSPACDGLTLGENKGACVGVLDPDRKYPDGFVCTLFVLKKGWSLKAGTNAAWEKDLPLTVGETVVQFKEGKWGVK